jgi:hypothetical protein
MHFNSNYIIEGGKTDWFADDGTRANPNRRSTSIPQYGEVVGNPNTARGQGISTPSIQQNVEVTCQSSLMDFGVDYHFR